MSAANQCIFRCRVLNHDIGIIFLEISGEWIPEWGTSNVHETPEIVQSLIYKLHLSHVCTKLFTNKSQRA